MIKKSWFWWAMLTVLLALVALALFPWRPARFGTLFCGALALGAGITALATYFASRFPLCRVLSRIGQVGFLLFALSFLFIQGIIITGERADPAAQDADLLLVLGAGLIGERPSATLQARLDAALEFLDAHPDAQAILCGGQGDDELISEAEAMRRYLVSQGIADERLLLEDRSTSTIENIENARALFVPDGAQTAVLSSDFHLARARVLMRRAGLDPYALPAPTPFRTLKVVYHMREYCTILTVMATGSWSF